MMFRQQLGRAADSEVGHNDAHDRLQEGGDEKARLKPRCDKTSINDQLQPRKVR